MKSYSDNLGSQIKSNKNSFEEKLNDLKRVIDKNEEKKDLNIKVIEQSIKVQNLELERKILHNEGELWEMQGVHKNALRCYIKECSVSLELGYEWNLLYRTDDIIKMINKISDLEGSILKTLDELLEKFPVKYNGQKEKIDQSLKRFRKE